MLMPPKLAKKCNDLMDLKICVAPSLDKNKCSQKIIRSHAPQKKRILESIAEEGHVLGLVGRKFSNAFSTPDASDIDYSPERIGINNASTFRGYCDYHDNSIYKDIEGDDLSLTPRAKFLHCYRAVCREYYKLITKEKISQAHYIASKQHRLPPDRIKFAKAFWDGAKIGLSTMHNTKEKFDEILLAKEYESKFKTHTKLFSGEINSVSLGCAMPHYDFHGNFINHGTSGNPLNHLICHATAKTDVGFAFIYGWLNEHDETGSAFWGGIADINSESDNLAVLLTLFENTFWRESWWNSLSRLVQIDLMDKLASKAWALNSDKNLYKFSYDASDYKMTSEFLSND